MWGVWVGVEQEYLSTNLTTSLNGETLVEARTFDVPLKIKHRRN